MRISDWSSDVCSSDLVRTRQHRIEPRQIVGLGHFDRPQAFEMRGDDLAVEQPPAARDQARDEVRARSEEHTSELQSLMRISYAVFCLKKDNKRKRMKSRT